MQRPDTLPAIVHSADTTKRETDSLVSKLADTKAGIIQYTNMDSAIKSGSWLGIETLLTFAGLVIAVLVPMIIRRRERRKLLSVYENGRWYDNKKLRYELFRGARVNDRVSRYANRPDLEANIQTKIREGGNLILLGAPLAGKTRTMVETLKGIPKTDYLIALPAEYRDEILFPRRSWLRRKTHKAILLMDDMQMFFSAPYDATRLIEAALKKKFQIVANCRTAGEWQTLCRVYQSLTIRFGPPIEIPVPTDEEVDNVLRLNKLEGMPNHYDRKNIGTLIIDLDIMRLRYQGANNIQSTLLLCVKELYILGIMGQAQKITVGDIKELMAKAHGTGMSEDEWNKENQWMADMGFVTLKGSLLSPETVYLEQIIAPEHSVEETIKNGLKTFSNERINFSRMIYSDAVSPTAPDAKRVLQVMKEQEIPRAIGHYNALLARQPDFTGAYKVYTELLDDLNGTNKWTFYVLINHLVNDVSSASSDITTNVLNKACEKFEQAAGDEPNDATIFFYWGIASSHLAKVSAREREQLLEIGCQKFLRALEIEPDYVEAMNNLGVAYGEKVDQDRAIEYFERALALNPAHVGAMNNLGVAYEKKGNYDQAVKYFERALALDSDHVEAINNLGVTYTKKADLDQAIKYFERVLAINPVHVGAIYNLGVAYREKEDLDRIIEVCERALLLNPAHVGAIYNLGVAYGEKGDLGLAIKYFERVLSLNPDHVGASYNLGVAYEKKGDLNLAIERFEHVLALNPAHSGAIYNLGVVYEKKGDRDQAIEHFERVLALNPGHVEAMNNLGVVYEKKGDRDQAIDYFERVLALNPNDVEAINNLGVVYQKKGDRDQAIEHFERVLALNPEDVEAMNNLGIAYGEKGDLDQAIEHFERVLGLNPDHSGAIYNLGIAYGEKGDLDQAIKHFERVLGLNPDYIGDIYNLGIAYGEKGDLDLAIEYFKFVLSLNPDHVGATYSLGVVYGNRGYLDEAIEYFERALVLRPADAKALYNLGIVYAENGDIEHAIKRFERALEINSEYYDVRFALATALLVKGDRDLAIDQYVRSYGGSPRVESFWQMMEENVWPLLEKNSFLRGQFEVILAVIKRRVREE